MICPYCKNNIADGCIHCPVCGVQLMQGCGEEDVNMFTPFKKYAQFSGRSRRKEYWLFVLLCVIVGVVVMALGEYGTIVSLLWNLAIFIPQLALAVRRLHDTGRSGWNLLWGLLPFIGGIILLVFMLQDSKPGPNQYGSNPKGIGNDMY